MPKENEMLFRVGIRNRGAITIEQVSVKLEDIRPQPQGLGIPLTLHPKDDHYRSEFPLHGGQTEHIDLFLKRDEVGQPRKGYFVICHVAAGERRESAFAVGQYAVTLSASGQNTRTCEGQFNIDVDAHGSTKISEIR